MKVIARTIALLRHLRAERGMALVLVTVIAMTSFMMAAIPRYLNRSLDDEILFRVGEASDNWRNITVSTTGRLILAEDDEILTALDRGGANYRDDLSPVLQEIIAGQSAFAESPEYELWPMRGQVWTETEFAPAVRGLRFRFQTGLEGQITLSAGRMPLERGPALVRWSEWAAMPGARGEPAFPRYEVVLPAGARDMLGLRVGDFAKLRIPFERVLLFVQVVGFYAVDDPSANYWNNDTRLHEPRIVGFAEDFRESESVRGFGEASSTTALTATAVYADFLSRTEPVSGDGGAVAPAYFDFLQRTTGQTWQYVWTYYVDPAAFDGGNFDEFARELQTLKITGGPVERLVSLDATERNPYDPQTPLLLPSNAQPQERSSTFAQAGVTVRNELSTVFARVAAQARLVSSVVALAAIGMLAVGLATIALLSALVADRRGGMVRLVRSRGASRGQLLLAQLVEGLLIAIPSAALGLGLAVLLVDGRANAWSQRAALATALFSVVLLLVAARVNILVRLGRLLGSRDAGQQPVASRRIVVEAFIVVLALAGVALLRQRGLEPAPDAAGLVSFDPFLAAAPVLLALAASVAGLRLYPLLIHAFTWSVRRLRGTVLFVGLRRITGQSFAARLPLLVMLLAISVSISTAIMAASVGQAQADFAWREVRADYRLDARQLALPELDLTGVPGIERQAREFRTDNAVLPRFENTAGFNVSSITLVALETAAFERIADGTIIDPQFPSALGAGPEEIPGPLPAIVSERWPEALGPAPEVGTDVALELVAPQFEGRMAVSVTVVARRASFPGIPDGTSFAVVDWDAFAVALEGQHPRPLRPTTIYLGGADGLRGEIEGAVGEQVITPILEAVGQTEPAGIAYVSRAEIVEQLRGTPLARGLADLSRLSTIFVALYAGLAIIIAMLLTARERVRTLAYLLTLGLNRRQAFLLVLVETAPGIVVASALGALVGVSIAMLVEPGLNLRAFAGPDAPVELMIDTSSVLSLLAGLVVGMLLLVIAFSAFSRRVDLNLELRIER